MYSSNGGTTFSDTRLSDESSYVADFYFDGGKIIVFMAIILLLTATIP
jgi:hypothetical protein